LQGVEADHLRTAGDLRIRLKAGMSSISAELDGMLSRSRGRKLRLLESEPES